MTAWTPERDDELRGLHGTMAIPAIAERMGVTRGSIRARVTKLGIRKRADFFTAAEIEEIRAAYVSATCGDDIGLSGLSARLGRCKASISRAARKMGLSDISRAIKRERKDCRTYGNRSAFLAVASDVARKRLADNGHPRGMLGKRHSPKTKEHLRETSKQWWAGLSPREKDNQVTSNLKAALAKHGRIGAPTGANREVASWKSGWREIGGRRIYFRSRWEANYARYLQWLKARGEIADWEYEPETFWFDAIKRGVRSYKPDFRVNELSGAKHLHEVKGWMDARSKTTLKRMAKYHPEETIILIREKEYRALSRFSALIGGWE